MFAYDEDPTYSHAVHHTTLTYARDFDPSTLTNAPRFETIGPLVSANSTEDKRAEKLMQLPYQTVLEREIHVRMPVQDVLNKQITVTCAHANCQNSIRTCHFHTCGHCGEDKRYAEAMCTQCARDPKRSTARGGHNPAAQVYLPNIPEACLHRVRYLGGGTHSSVHECLYDGLPACEKVLLKNDPSVLLDEARVMAQVDRHPNILRIFGICQRANGETSIILELMQYDLLDILKSFRRSIAKADLPKVVPNLVEYIAHAASGLRHMHRHGVIHRDVAARNMLFGNDVIKVADFGLAKCTSNRLTHGLPKPLSTAPECIRDLENPSVWVDKSDVWSFGLMICEVFELGTDPLEQFHHSVPALMDAVDRGWLPKKPTLCPDALWELTLRCLRAKPVERPSLDEIHTALAAYRTAHRHEPKLPPRTLTDAKAAPEVSARPAPRPSRHAEPEPTQRADGPPPTQPPAGVLGPGPSAPLTPPAGASDQKGWFQPNLYQRFPQSYQAPPTASTAPVDLLPSPPDYDVIRNLQSPIDILPQAPPPTRTRAPHTTEQPLPSELPASYAALTNGQGPEAGQRGRTADPQGEASNSAKGTPTRSHTMNRAPGFQPRNPMPPPLPPNGTDTSRGIASFPRPSAAQDNSLRRVGPPAKSAGLTSRSNAS